MKTKLLLLFLIKLFLIVGCLSSPDSCYYCQGTRQCKDPMDFNQVSPKNCKENNVCVKYMSTSENRKHEIVAHQLTYRNCFQPLYEGQDSCAAIKESEEMIVQTLNLSLIDFECYECDETNCNSASNSKTFFSILIFTLALLYLLV